MVRRRGPARPAEGTSVHLFRGVGGSAWSQASEVPALSFATMMQTKEVACLAELGPLVSTEVRTDTHHILSGARCADLSLGRGMSSTVAAWRHLWVTL